MTIEYVIICKDVRAKNTEINAWNTYTHNFSSPYNTYINMTIQE